MELYFIADIGSNHDGDLQRAKSLIKEAKKAGCNAVKFQMFNADTLINKKVFENMDKVAHQKDWNNIYDVYKKYELPKEWIPELKKECDKNKIDFLCTPYDIKAVKLLNDYVDIWKIGSGDITYWPLIKQIAMTKKKILLGCGASKWGEIRRVKNRIKMINKDLHILQCNTNYTANKNNFKYINLNAIRTEGYQGISDHTKGHTVVLGAIMIANEMLKLTDTFYIEKHLTDGKSESPDNNFAMLPTEFKIMIQESKNLFDALGDGVKRVEYNEQETHLIQRRAWYAGKNLKLGHEIIQDDLIALRPYCNDSLSPYELIGKKVNRYIPKYSLIRHGDIK